LLEPALPSQRWFILCVQFRQCRSLGELLTAAFDDIKVTKNHLAAKLRAFSNKLEIS